MLLAELLAASERVAGTRSRLAKIDALAQCLRRLDSPEIALGVAYLSGDTRQGRIGVRYATLKDALVAAPASAARLPLAHIDEALARLAQTKGEGSAAERARMLAELFARATAPEQDFLARLLLGELRQGALEGIMLDAIAKAANLPAERVRTAAMRAGGPPVVAEAALTEGEAGLARFALKVFQPVQPMLAQPAEDVADALGRLGAAAFEWKLDGARVQVHKSGEEVRVYTRSLNEVTAAVPEVVAALREVVAREIIVDGETIALKPEGTPYPFQETMRRFGRKLDVEALRATFPLSVFFFDCLLADGEDLTARPARQRRRHGEGASRYVRSGQPRRRLAQDQEGAHPRPRRHRRRMGQRPPQRVAFQSTPRRARPGHRRLRHARQDLQGHDRQDARLADRAFARAGDLARGPRRARAAAARRRDRVQRNPGEPALPRRLRAALRARQALPR